VPTLVIGHGRDLAHPLAHAERLAALIPGARLVEITPKATDRAAYLRGFRQAVVDFLRALPPP
jgi:pimeloyl-ACP methyl ester carboxylesterase